jgi:hypothetical protein
MSKNVKTGKVNLHSAVYDDSQMHNDDELCCVALKQVLKEEKEKADKEPQR